MKPAYRNLIRPAILAAIGLVVVSLFFFGFLRIYKIPTNGMSPTFIPDDYVFATKSGKKEADFKQMDIIVFSSPSNPKSRFIQRIAALPGDKVEVKNGHLSVNDQPIVSASGAKPAPGTDTKSDMTLPTYPLVVEPGKVFVIGDNYENSLDSRYFGTIEIDSITHTPKFIVLPFNRIRSFGSDDND
ncbi:signal peptidase I [Haloferula sp.]|uniref:signal peptidase I n=1 Tax=Haloferula sp. TaxID=2497595 RepID=UPI00329E2F37